MPCTRPKKPPSMRRLHSRNQGVKRKFSCTTSGTPAASASAVIASASRRSLPKGFWQMVGMPRAIAARTAGCLRCGRQAHVDQRRLLGVEHRSTGRHSTLGTP